MNPTKDMLDFKCLVVESTHRIVYLYGSSTFKFGEPIPALLDIIDVNSSYQFLDSHSDYKLSFEVSKETLVEDKIYTTDINVQKDSVIVAMFPDEFAINPWSNPLNDAYAFELTEKKVVLGETKTLLDYSKVGVWYA